MEETRLAAEDTRQLERWILDSAARIEARQPAQLHPRLSADVPLQRAVVQTCWCDCCNVGSSRDCEGGRAEIKVGLDKTVGDNISAPLSKLHLSCRNPPPSYLARQNTSLSHAMRAGALTPLTLLNDAM